MHSFEMDRVFAPSDVFKTSVVSMLISILFFFSFSHDCFSVKALLYLRQGVAGLN